MHYVMVWTANDQLKMFSIQLCCMYYCERFVFPLLAAPVIEVESKYEKVKVKAGALVLLSANVTGFPQPSLTWNHNGKPLQKAQNVNIDTNVDVTSVSIKGSAAKNGGKYELVATNEVGEATAEFSVVVTGKFWTGLRQTKIWLPVFSSQMKVNYLFDDLCKISISTRKQIFGDCMTVLTQLMKSTNLCLLTLKVLNFWKFS